MRDQNPALTAFHAGSAEEGGDAPAAKLSEVEVSEQGNQAQGEEQLNDQTPQMLETLAKLTRWRKRNSSGTVQGPCSTRW